MFLTLKKIMGSLLLPLPILLLIIGLGLLLLWFSLLQKSAKTLISV
ncbi:envelope biogenesis factor ElyC, partial [Erwinia amylovora]|nr:envelope biogenesis factor ElyC [Erwinia amylovora]